MQPSKSPVNALILFDKNLDISFYLCINYKDINDLNIKTKYAAVLISEILDWFSRVKQFIWLDLTSVYHWMRI